MADLLGPVTNAEQAGWQLSSARGLVKLLEAAATQDLPVLQWQVSNSRRLVGRTEAGDSAARREAFERWCVFLGAVDCWPEREVAGTVYLHATRQDWGADDRPWHSDGVVDVVVVADVRTAEHVDDDADGV